MSDLLYAAIAVTFFFAFWNGFTDAANAISTIVATRVLSPLKAVSLSALGNLLGLFLGIEVAKTIGAGIILETFILPRLVLAALIGGLVWDVITWWIALPVSESHVLVGGLVGAGIGAGGWEVVQTTSILFKVVIPMLIAPAIAFGFAFVFTAGVMHLSRRVAPAKLNKAFGRLQLLSSFWFSVTHGSNDGQKAIGIVAFLLVTGGLLAAQPLVVPIWVILGVFGALSFGTLFGGWRIVRTMAFKLTHMRPYQGFSAETGAALLLMGTSQLGFPVSTTHAISGGIMGVGATRRLSAVRWGVARKIVWTWLLTIPASGVFAFAMYLLISAFV